MMETYDDDENDGDDDDYGDNDWQRSLMKIK